MLVGDSERDKNIGRVHCTLKMSSALRHAILSLSQCIVLLHSYLKQKLDNRT